MAADGAHMAADAEIEAFQHEVAGIYAEAQKTASRALMEYLERFREQDDEWRERVARGEATEAQWRAWRRGKILTGRRYRVVLKQVSEGYTHANEVAMDALDGRLPGVYAENYNYGTFQAYSAAGVDDAFALQDASTVQRLLADHGSYLPTPTVNAAKDAAWNRRLLANQITQGVLLGESMAKIARRVQAVTGSNMATAMRTARTSVTAAENAGRVDSYRRAQSLGIKLEQEWLATLDGRTRHTHRLLDGERVEVGGTFANGCRYPGDPEAPYAETCNCRCTLIAAVEGVDYGDGKRWSKLPEGVTYEEWKAGKPAVNGAKPANRTISEFMEMPGTKRKMDVAGVSKTEARKRLSRQLEDYGIPSSGFRKMSAGDQQKVLDAALAPSGTPVVDGRRQFKRIKGVHDADRDLAAVNPGYKGPADKLDARSINCQRCVPAYELRRRGYDVVAKPRPINRWGNPQASDPMGGATDFKKVFVGSEWIRGGDDPLAKITEAIGGWGEGSRAEVCVSWDPGKCDSGGRHVFVAENVGGEVRFVDPQSGNNDVSCYFDIIKPNETEFARIDELDVSELIDYCCTTRGGHADAGTGH